MTKNKKLLAWVKEVQDMCEPDQIYWCDGSQQEYDRLLPGNPNTTFLKGFSLEQMQNRQAAAQEYNRYLQMTRQGGQAQHAYNRLKGWGFAK